jgi:hypothetical protein
LPSRSLLVDLIGLLLIALVVVVGYKLSPLLLPTSDLTVQPDPACDLQRQACAVMLPGGGRLELESMTRPIPLARPFGVVVSVAGTTASRVEVDFAGVDMNMGLLRPRLADQGGGRFTGEVALPVCVTGRMAWQATVLVETAGARIAVPFRFVAGGPAQ